MKDDSFVNTVIIGMSDRKTRETDTSKTRHSIVDAANTLIAEKGLKGTSVSAVARKLGMSHANVYRHFSSRDALLKAAAKGWMKEMRDACQAAVGAKTVNAEKLSALVIAIRDQLTKRAVNPAALDLYDFALREMEQDVKYHHAHRAGIVSDIVGPDTDTTAVLDALRGFTDPHLLFATDVIAAPERIRKLCDLLCR